MPLTYKVRWDIFKPTVIIFVDILPVMDIATTR